MTTETTSPAARPDSALQAAGTMRGEWRAFTSYLRRPVLPDAIAPARTAMRGTLRMVGLDLVIMSAIIAILIAIVAIGIELPDNLNAELDLNLFTIGLIVIAAPLLEETAFRSWLTGRPSFLLAFAALGVAGVLALATGMAFAGETGRFAATLVLLCGLGLAVICLIALRKRGAPGWFRTVFPGLFWASSTAFALVHLLNYAEGALAILLPLVIPQFILGTIAAYVRVHYGLVAAIILHALHNGFAITLALIAMNSGMTA